MTGAAIAAEVAAALAEAGAATGDGTPLTATILRRERTGGTNRNPVYSDVPHAFTAVLGQFSAREREASGIPATAVKLTLAVGPVSPTTGDRVTVAGVTYDIENVWPNRPGGTSLYWTVDARV